MKALNLIVLVLLFASCKDLLEESPKEIASETFYKTAAEMESAVFATYGALQANQTVFGRHYHTIQMSQVDYGYGRGSYATITNFAGLDATNVNRVGDMWTAFYTAIRNANLVIFNGDRALSNGVTQSQVNALVAEARFMRAFCYFYLVQNWGGVPLRNENNMETRNLARSPVAEVYAFITKDLEFAENNLPSEQALIGRATKWAAKTLLTDVLVNLEKWPEAKAKALEVINSNKFSLLEISVANDYYKIFGPDVVNTKEEIFYLKFSGTKPSNFTFMLHHPNSPYYNGDGAYGIYTDSVKNTVIKDWDYHDLRKGYNLYNMDIGVGSKTTMLYKKFIEPNKSLGLSTDYPLYRYADLLLFYAEADAHVTNGASTDGMEKLNMLHRRAFGKPTNVASTVDFKVSDYTDKETFLNLIYKERMYELFCEGKRFLELKRTGKLKQTILAVQGKTVLDKHLLWPIPNSEYFYNDLIDEVKDQNPGY